MPVRLVEQYRRWFEYEQASHGKVIVALRAVPEEKRQTEAFRKAVELLAHLAAARGLWLYRLGGASEEPQEFFPQNVPLEEVEQRINRMHAAWTGFLAKLDDAEIERSRDYQSQEGPWFRNTIADILTQVFGHSWYHRGQIALLVRSLGCEPAKTDFIFWARERIPGPR